MSEEIINLAQVPRELAELIGDKAPVPTYRTVYAGVLDGSIPAERRNGRWYMRRSDLNALAKKLCAGRGRAMG